MDTDESWDAREANAKLIGETFEMGSALPTTKERHEMERGEKERHETVAI